MKRLYFLIICLLFVSGNLQAGRGTPNHVSRPFLLSPTAEEISLAGKDSLLFKWQARIWHYPREYYDFRLYQGRQINAQTLMLKKRLPANRFRVSIPADTFKAGQTYTCSVRHVVGIVKSDRATRSFMVTE